MAEIIRVTSPTGRHTIEIPLTAEVGNNLLHPGSRANYVTHYSAPDATSLQSSSLDKEEQRVLARSLAAEQKAGRNHRTPDRESSQVITINDQPQVRFSSQRQAVNYLPRQTEFPIEHTVKVSLIERIGNSGSKLLAWLTPSGRDAIAANASVGEELGNMLERSHIPQMIEASRKDLLATQAMERLNIEDWNRTLDPRAQTFLDALPKAVHAEFTISRTRDEIIPDHGQGGEGSKGGVLGFIRSLVRPQEGRVTTTSEMNFKGPNPNSRGIFHLGKFKGPTIEGGNFGLSASFGVSTDHEHGSVRSFSNPGGAGTFVEGPGAAGAFSEFYNSPTYHGVEIGGGDVTIDNGDSNFGSF